MAEDGRKTRPRDKHGRYLPKEDVTTAAPAVEVAPSDDDGTEGHLEDGRMLEFESPDGGLKPEDVYGEPQEETPPDPPVGETQPTRQPEPAPESETTSEPDRTAEAEVPAEETAEEPEIPSPPAWNLAHQQKDQDHANELRDAKTENQKLQEQVEAIRQEQAVHRSDLKIPELTEESTTGDFARAMKDVTANNEALHAELKSLRDHVDKEAQDRQVRDDATQQMADERFFKTRCKEIGKRFGPQYLTAAIKNADTALEEEGWRKDVQWVHPTIYADQIEIQASRLAFDHQTVPPPPKITTDTGTGGSVQPTSKAGTNQQVFNDMQRTGEIPAHMMLED